MRASRWLTSPLGLVEGGVTACLAEFALAGAIQTTVPAGTAYAPIDLRVQFIRIVLQDLPFTIELLFLDGEEAVNEISSRFLPVYDGRARFSINRPTNSAHYVILTHPDAEKAHALGVVLKELGVPPDQAIAMGDSESDIGMFRLTGLGIAMRNAPDEVQREALHVAPSNDEDGVAWAIRKFLL